MSEASDLRRTPLHAEHVALGARLVPFAGYEMPVQYEGILAEHRAVRGAAGLFDLSHMGEVEVRGEEAVAFLRYALVSDPGALSVGQAQYSMMCEADGGIVDDLIVYRLDEQRLWIVCNASNRATVVEQLHRLLERGDFGAEVDDRSDRIALIAPQGPNGRSSCSAASPTSIWLRISNYHATSGTVAEIDCLVARTGYTGEDGFELFCDARRAPGPVACAARRRRGSSGSSPAGSGRATRCGSRRGCPCMATSSTARRIPSRSTSGGW